MSVIKRPYELRTNPTIRVLLYGQPGIWKTTVGTSAPASLLLDFDGGVHRLRPEHRVDTVQVNAWKDVEDLLKEDLSAYKTIVIDTAGKMLDFMTEAIIKENSKLGKSDGSLSLQGYGARKNKFIGFLKQVSSLRKNIVFIAHEKEERDGDTRFIRPEIGGSSGNDLVKELDLVGYMEASGKEHTISFNPTEKYYGKNTCELPAVIKLPPLDMGKVCTTLTDIFKTYELSLEKRNEVAEQYYELLARIKGAIMEVKDAKGANYFVDQIKSGKPIWDSNLQASYMIANKAKELGLTLNKDKKYVDPTNAVGATNGAAV